MIYRTPSTTTAICDGCGPGWWKRTRQTQPPTLPGSRRAAIRTLTADHGWHIKRHLLQRTTMRCAGCGPTATCPHPNWRPDCSTGSGYGSYLVCDRCGAVADYLNEPPAGHPDSMTAVLSDADEEWLAALDAELDPDHANEEV